jgi:hypothetical protein
MCKQVRCWNSVLTACVFWSKREGWDLLPAFASGDAIDKVPARMADVFVVGFDGERSRVIVNSDQLLERFLGASEACNVGATFYFGK